MPHLLKRIALYCALFSTIFTPLAAFAVTVTTDIDGTLIKGSEPAIYFYGSDQKRYVFPNDKIFFTWYSDFSSVQTVTDEELANIPIGGNVTYRPGTKLVKITTDPKVYAVSGGGILRWIISEALAKSLYGDDWAKQVQDVPDSLFTNYHMGDSINDADAYHPETERNTFHRISNDLIEKLNPGSVSSTEAVAPVAHSLVLTSLGEQTFSWTDSEVSPLGYKFVWSKNEGPTYPTHDGGWSFYLPESSTKSARIFSLEPGTYHVRICVYLGGKCGDYSNEVVYTKTGPATKPTTASTSTERGLHLFNSQDQFFYWLDSVTSTQGYRLLWSKNEHPTYPARSGDSSELFSTMYGSLFILESGTYYVRACAATNDGCGIYSNQVKLVVGTPTANPTTPTSTTARVIRLVNAYDQKFFWTDTATSTHGYKFLLSKNENPVYPPRSGDSATILSNSYTTISAEPGTYYIRVCDFNDSGCTIYSNQVKLVVAAPTGPVTPTSTTPTVSTTSTESGTAPANTVPRAITLIRYSGSSFIWSDTASSTPWALLWSKNEHPTYPTREGDFSLLTNTNYAGASIEPGFYYARVCAVADGACVSPYSNETSFSREASSTSSLLR
jgi:hypothetical protein